jgi:hypothetical protein
MPAVPSFASDATSTKKDEAYSRTVLAHDQSGLPAIKDEDEVDEGAKLAGETAQVFTQEEQNAVLRKIDRRVRLPSLFSSALGSVILTCLSSLVAASPHVDLLLAVPRQGAPALSCVVGGVRN